jgi:hypothetical protein
VRTFTEGARDEYGDTGRVVDDDVVREMQFDREPEQQVDDPSGPFERAAAVAFADESDLPYLSDGDADRPYPSQIQDPLTDEWYVVDAVSLFADGEVKVALSRRPESRGE